jgi:hypothetical protein
MFKYSSVLQAKYQSLLILVRKDEVKQQIQFSEQFVVTYSFCKVGKLLLRATYLELLRPLPSRLALSQYLSQAFHCTLTEFHTTKYLTR